MLFFTDRLKLEKMFYRWARGHEPMIKECPMSVVSFLEGNGLLNEDKVKEFIKEESDDNDV